MIMVNSGFKGLKATIVVHSAQRVQIKPLRHYVHAKPQGTILLVKSASLPRARRERIP